MKNIFKLMGIALLATTMLVGCNKEKEEEEDLTPRLSVTINGQEFSNFPFKQVKVVTLDGEQCLWIEGHPQDCSDASQISSETQVCPGFRIVLRGITTGDYESTSINGETMYLNGGVKHFEFYKSGALYQGATGTFLGDWWGMNAKVKLKKYDESTKTISLTASGDMFCSGQALLQGMGVDASDKGTMSIEINNYSFAQ